MNILFLDVASHSGLLACVTGERVTVPRTIDRHLGDHELMPLIEEVVKESGWTFPLLTHLACVIGPGGFTSLRVGVSLINALAWGLKIPAAAIHLSDLCAARVRSYEHDFLWLHSTKRTELFLRGFGAWAKIWPDPVCVTIDAFLQNMRQSPPNLQTHIYVGELLPDHCAAIEHAGFVAATASPLTDVLPSFLASCAYHEHILQPWYGRGW